MTNQQFEELIQEIPESEFTLDSRYESENIIELSNYYIVPDFSVKEHVKYGGAGYSESYMREAEAGVCEFTLHFTQESKVFDVSDNEILLTDYQRELIQKTLDNKCSTSETFEI